LLTFQCCSRVLLPPDDRRSNLEALRRPALSTLARKGILKKVNTKCRKMSQCPYCEELNGEALPERKYLTLTIDCLAFVYVTLETLRF
jgi:hypothetical protein